MQGKKIESGVQLFSRINQRIYLEGINPKIFPEGGPYRNQTLEIVGKQETDKINLAIDLLIRCILPTEYCKEWKNCGAVFIATDFQITLFQIIKIMDLNLKERNIPNRTNVIESALKNLTIFNCYNKDQLLMTFYNLEKLIQRNENISLVLLDNISSQYWAARFNSSSTHTAASKFSLYQHSLNNFEILQNLIKNLNIVLVFVRSDHALQNKNFTKDVDYRINVQIDLLDANNFKAVVTNYEKKSENVVFYNLHTNCVKFL